MYHPSRGGVRGGRDQFNWDDVKVDKHRENYIGHSIKAPVGRWQKGKDLHWYAKGNTKEAEIAAREEIARIKEEEEQLMREALGLAPKREKKPQGCNIDKHEAAELFKKGVKDESAPDHAVGERVEGLGFAPAPKPTVVKRDEDEKPRPERTSDKAKGNVVNSGAHLPQRQSRGVISSKNVEDSPREPQDHNNKHTGEIEGEQRPRLAEVSSAGAECSTPQDVERQDVLHGVEDTTGAGGRHRNAQILSRKEEEKAREGRQSKDRGRSRRHEEKISSRHGYKDRNRDKRYSESESEKDVPAPKRSRREEFSDDDCQDRRKTSKSREARSRADVDSRYRDGAKHSRAYGDQQRGPSDDDHNGNADSRHHDARRYLSTSSTNDRRKAEGAVRDRKREAYRASPRHHEEKRSHHGGKSRSREERSPYSD